MAKVFIKEYADVPMFNGLPLQVGNEPGVAEQVVAVGVGSTQSAAFNAKTKFIRVHTDVICSIAFGANPTADANSARMAADQTEFFGVKGGDKLATITNT